MGSTSINGSYTIEKINKIVISSFHWHLFERNPR